MRAEVNTCAGNFSREFFQEPKAPARPLPIDGTRTAATRSAFGGSSSGAKEISKNSILGAYP
jgi:hypothetical protein